MKQTKAKTDWRPGHYIGSAVRDKMKTFLTAGLLALTLPIAQSAAVAAPPDGKVVRMPPRLAVYVANVEEAPAEIRDVLIEMIDWVADHPDTTPETNQPLFVVAVGDPAQTATYIEDRDYTLALELHPQEDQTVTWRYSVRGIELPYARSGGFLDRLFERVAEMGTCLKNVVIDFVENMDTVEISVEIELGPTGGTTISISGTTTGAEAAELMRNAWRCISPDTATPGGEP